MADVDWVVAEAHQYEARGIRFSGWARPGAEGCLARASVDFARSVARRAERAHPARSTNPVNPCRKRCACFSTNSPTCYGFSRGSRAIDPACRDTIKTGSGFPAIDAARIVSHPRMSEPNPKKSISSHRWILGYLMQEKAVFFPSLAALFFTADAVAGVSVVSQGTDRQSDGRAEARRRSAAGAGEIQPGGAPTGGGARASGLHRVFPGAGIHPLRRIRAQPAAARSVRPSRPPADVVFPGAARRRAQQPRFRAISGWFATPCSPPCRKPSGRS